MKSNSDTVRSNCYDGRNAVDERTSALIDKGFSALEEAADGKFICRIFDLSSGEENRSYNTNSHQLV